MGLHIDAIFENGVFRPQQPPADIADGQWVSLTIESNPAPPEDLADVADLLDVELLEGCRQNGGTAPSLEEVRRILSVFKGSISDLIAQERDER